MTDHLGQSGVSPKPKPTCPHCGAEKVIDYELGGYACPNHCTFAASYKALFPKGGTP